MKTIPIKEISVPTNRIRRDFNPKALKALEKSIGEVGLFLPIILRNDGRTLVAGERRTRAVASLNKDYSFAGETVSAGHVPFLTLGELSPELLLQIELEENVIRNDITWQERTRAEAQLHALRCRQNPEQTVTDTAREIRGREDVSGADANRVSNAVVLEKYLDHPLIAGCKDESTARKLLKDHLGRQERKRRLAEVDPARLKYEHKLVVGDCFSSIVPENFFDCIVTDPPYGIEIHKKDTFDIDKHEYDDSDEYFTKRICGDFPKLAFRAAKENAHIYVFCDIRRFSTLAAGFFIAKWQVWPRPLIWDKGNTGSFGNIEYGFRSCYDAILFARKGDKKVTAGYRDVIPINQLTDLPHPAGKPSALYVDILRRSCLPGDVVADFFCGHGPIFSAAHELSLTAWGWEIHDKYAEMAQETLLEIAGD